MFIEDKEAPNQSRGSKDDVSKISSLDAENYFTDSEITELYATARKSKYQAFDAFKNPLDLLFTFNPSVRDGTMVPHKWQIEELKLLSRPYTKDNPLKHVLVAVNGSGKDSIVISSFAVWLAVANIRSRCVITSASANQMNSQTEPSIRVLAEAMNVAFKETYGIDKLFVIKRQHIICPITGSEIKMFVTDEPGRAEGYHPWPDAPGGKVALIINEGKTVPDLIYDAFRRCTHTHYIVISSPGKTSGELYNISRNAVTYPQPWKAFTWYLRKVTSYDCSHISKEVIEFEKNEKGEHSPWFRSRHKAEFTTLDEQVVITKEVLDRCLEAGHIEYGEYAGTIKHKLPGLLHAGLDLAKGGDENTFYVFDGNKFKGAENFRCDDITVTGPILIDYFTKYGFTKETADHIYADDGGIGGGIIDLLWRAGWMVVRTVNQSKPIDTGIIKYSNRGAQLWLRFAKLVEERQVILPKDNQKLLDQLSSRGYDQNDQGKFRLESKPEARLKGHGSPDRADAVVLAFSRLTIHDLLETDGVELVSRKMKYHMPSQKELVQQQVNLLRMERIAGRSLRYGEEGDRKPDVRNIHRMISAGRLVNNN